MLKNLIKMFNKPSKNVDEVSNKGSSSNARKEDDRIVIQKSAQDIPINKRQMSDAERPPGENTGLNRNVVTDPAQVNEEIPKQSPDNSLGLPSDLPDEIVQLAIINDAFRNGLLTLQAMNLDKDLYWSAVEDLRSKYYKAREPYIRRAQSPSSVDPKLIENKGNDTI